MKKTCKYVHVCGSKENCLRCEGYEKKKPSIITKDDIFNKPINQQENNRERQGCLYEKDM